MSDNDDYMAGKNGHVGDVGNFHYSAGQYQRNVDQLQQRQFEQTMASAKIPSAPSQPVGEVRRIFCISIACIAAALLGFYGWQNHPGNLLPLALYAAGGFAAGLTGAYLVSSVRFWCIAIVCAGVYWLFQHGYAHF